MLDDIRRFATDDFPEKLREKAWSEVLQKVLMTSQAGPSHHRLPLEGYVSSRRSSLDSVFVRVQSSPHTLMPHPENARRYGSALIVVAILEGAGCVADEAETVSLHAGEIILLDPTRQWRMDMHTDYRAVFVKLEAASFVLRLVRTSGQDLNKISAATGVGAVCVNLVRSIADQLDQLDTHELLPMEATLTELLITCLSHVDDAAAADTTSVQLGHLRRVCRTIEAKLVDAEFTIEDIGRLDSLSTRYIQKLFKVGGTTFGEYVKMRRLERCRIDLSNPSLAHFSISELCFRWGFGDAANFSRAFTARFGISPKQYRAGPPKELAPLVQRGRPAVDPASVRPRIASQTALAARVDGNEAHLRQHHFENVLGDHARYALALALAPKRAAATAASETTHATQQAIGTGKPPPNHYYVPASDKTVHWGYFSRAIKPILSVRSGDILTIETLTQHATDDRERMIEGDPGAESVFHWTAEQKNVDRRGAGPIDASIYGRGAGEGFGVHICTGPVFVQGAEPGDILEIRILDIQLRPSCSTEHYGRSYGSNAAAWWGFHYHDLITEPRKREVVTIYEIDRSTTTPCAKAVYSFKWTPQTDPFGVLHPTIDYPGIPVDPATIERKYGVLKNARVPVRPHFGVLAVAPRETGNVDSVPPGYFGGNLDNWRAGKGSTLFLPVSVDGALFSVGDPHASQGDSELCGTAIECSLTGTFQLVLHKKQALVTSFFANLNYPFLETATEWVIQGLSFPNHFAELGPQAQSQIYGKSSLDAAMRDAFHKTRVYLMEAHTLDEDEAISLISVAVDFGVTQVVNGNWGVHAVIRKAIFPDYLPTQP
ncbi:acetamidase/formamidase family protein [Pseudomonas typographi]|uniref:acetamidase/formamidase family protein n=1 Tax=Pseudomonas typographi TaxID=2715964 RepID=UPI001688E794|nr:acetamidase/formamidase family protein [Pseudomonas typographi]MBD1550549.1 helix-turn-helix domain-containing protein [Pseudomonas typographi]MBD1586864.1 helix-turn-helix domain-containing protein [Pseudomonas typographi]